MREKYESLALAELKEIAKARGMKRISGLKKAELIELMLAEDEKDKEAGRDVEPKPVLRGMKEPSFATSGDRANRYERRERAPRAKGAESAERPVREQRPSAADGSNNSSGNNNINNGNNGNNSNSAERPVREQRPAPEGAENRQSDDRFPSELDSGITARGILEVMPDGFGFIRSENFLPGENDVYVAPSQIRRFGLKTGDIIEGNTRVKTMNEKFSALLYLKKVNGFPPEFATRRRSFEDMTPIFPDKRIKLETPGASVAMRIMDLMSPVGKGQRGMIVSPPKAGKTTLLKEVAKSILKTAPDMHMIILLIDERPEEVTDIREAIQGPNVEVIYSTFDELPEHHKRVAEMVIERAKRLVEHRKDVCILLDSITRLTRAYNLTVPPSGRTLSGGLDPAALHMPKRFFGAARNMREGGSLTILATALVETGSKMDDVVYEEFKGTGNMEMVLDRKLSEKRVFPAIDIPKSGTRREDLLLTPDELEAINVMRKALNGLKSDEAVDKILDMFYRTKNNTEFVETVKKMKFI
ncbi:MAG: transcription termination factor Rho [Lachnospiraceae bacterium]|nr:transcription termination factor Rho [Lachnospiraceae bacterium]MDE6918850.1 transcription termination factor Rho [Lachnospiraceae bacterium]MDE6991594.1 transcription termination factor Rho [Lachnospiraceae bacterium]MDE6999887.1 transcription termination factor Rho [Lachnospiraceae bacterium]